MKRLLHFDDEGFYVDEEIVSDGTRPNVNQYIADIDEDISFHRIKLVDGQLVEGLTPEEIAERENQVPPKDPTFEKLESIEKEVQTGNITTFEVLATVYEDMGTSAITQFDVMATMYEEILNLRAEVEALKGATPQ